MIDSHCWVDGTWTHRPDAENPLLGQAGELEHMRCAATEDGSSMVEVDEEGNKIVPNKPCWHHLYYQWVGLMLIFQAGCFYFPKYLWGIWEKGLIESMTKDLDKKTLIKGLQTKEELKDDPRVKNLAENFWRTRGYHNTWASKFRFSCFLELLSKDFGFSVISYDFPDFVGISVIFPITVEF